MRHERLPEGVADLFVGRVRIENGWCKGALEDANGNVCTLGAVHGSGYLAAVRLLRDALAPMWGGWLSNFNNHPDTTKADVLALFDRAIKLGVARGAMESAHG